MFFADNNNIFSSSVKLPSNALRSSLASTWLLTLCGIVLAYVSWAVVELQRVDETGTDLGRGRGMFYNSITSPTSRLKGGNPLSIRPISISEYLGEIGILRALPWGWWLYFS